MTEVVYRGALPGTAAGLRAAAEEIQQLRDFLAKSVAESQILGVDGPDQQILGRSASFVSRFSSVFCLNYDFLAYRALLRAKDEQMCSFTDGFRSFRDQESRAFRYRGFCGNPNRVRLFYPHGALFIRPHDRYGAQKVTKESIELVPVQVRQHLGLHEDLSLAMICLLAYEQIKPLIVAGHSHLDKLDQISSNIYLQEVWNHFEQISGSLFTYGWSLGDSDRHLLDAIAKNPDLRRLYVGIFGHPDSPENQRIIHTATQLVVPRPEPANLLSVHFYSTDSAGVWREPHSLPPSRARSRALSPLLSRNGHTRP